jgi:hypothetical protein
MWFSGGTTFWETPLPDDEALEGFTLMWEGWRRISDALGEDERDFAVSFLFTRFAPSV